MTIYAGFSGYSQEIPVTTAAPVIVQSDSVFDKTTLSFPLTVKANPGAAGTMLVEYRVSLTGTWVEWPAGAVATITVYLLEGPVQALRFTAATDDGSVEVSQ